MWKQPTATFLGCESDYENARAVLFGAPFDGTTSFRPGTRFASKAMRADSYGIETYSPYLDRDLSEISVFDGSDLEIAFGNTEKMLQQVQDTVEQVVNAGKLPIMIGGEHLVTLGAIRALVKQHPDLVVLHLDAHTDLRQHYLGETLSHATVMRRIYDLLGDQRIFQFGIRSGEKEEFAFASKHLTIERFGVKTFGDIVQKLAGKPVYFTLDLDVLDPSVFPGTGTPEPGGISFASLLEVVTALSSLRVVGADIVELSPSYDSSGSSTAVACKILRELLLAVTPR